MEKSPTRPKDGYPYHAIEAGYYDRIFLKYSGVQSKWHHLKFTHVIKHMGNYQRHLDIGCGAGTLISQLPADKISVGVDIALTQIEYARARYQTRRHHFLNTGPSAALPFGENQFDVVTIIEVIEHLSLDHNKQLLGEVLRVLKSGGVLLMTTPNYASLWPLVEIIVNKCSKVSYEDQHITRFTRPRLSAMLNDLSFIEISVRPFQWIAPFAAALGWGLADWVERVESPWLSRWFGLLLFAQARKR